MFRNRANMKNATDYSIFGNYKCLEEKIKDIDTSNLTLAAVIPTLGRNPEIFKVISELEANGYEKIVIGLNGKLSESPNGLVKELYYNHHKNPNSNADLIGTHLGKYNAVLGAVQHIVNVTGQHHFDYITIMDDDGEMLIKDAEKVIKTAKLAEDMGLKVSFGKGDRYQNQTTSYMSQLAKSLINLRLSEPEINAERERSNLDNFWLPVNDLRSGHMAFTQDYTLNLIQNNLMKHGEYDCEISHIINAYRNGYFVPQIPVEFPRVDRRYADNEIPFQDFIDYQKVFGEDVVNQEVKKIMGDHMSIVKNLQGNQVIIEPEREENYDNK